MGRQRLRRRLRDGEREEYRSAHRGRVLLECRELVRMLEGKPDEGADHRNDKREKRCSPRAPREKGTSSPVRSYPSPRRVGQAGEICEVESFTALLRWDAG